MSLKKLSDGHDTPFIIGVSPLSCLNLSHDPVVSTLMKTHLKKPVKNFTPVFLMLAAMFLLGCGCNTSKPAPDPLAGWQKAYNHDPDPAIVKDYQDYIQKIPAKDNNSVGPVFYFEDGTGQHAVSMEIFVKGENASWHYVIIYDKENKRIQAMKYGYAKYQS
jgi:hypothetical protein